MKRILVLSLMLAGGLIGFYYQPLSSENQTIPETPSSAPIQIQTTTTSFPATPLPKAEVEHPSPISRPEGPPSLPDLDVAKQSRELMTEEWARTRARILQDEFQISAETLSNLDQRNKTYLEAVSKWIKPASEDHPMAARLATPEQMKQISANYQKDVIQLVGENAFTRLASARSKLVDQYRFAGYSIPLSTF